MVKTLPKNQVGTILHVQNILINDLHKFVVLCMETP